MKNGSVLKRSFQSTATIKDLFDLARSEDRNIGNADISLIQVHRRPFSVKTGQKIKHLSSHQPSNDQPIFFSPSHSLAKSSLLGIATLLYQMLVFAQVVR
jgi:hypothetical protein